MAKKPDWEAIESAYRAGLMSLREIASLHGITHGAINKRAKKEGWERNLKEKIKLKADALVSKREVSTQNVISERILIEANAEVIANVRMEHRGDIRRARELANHLFEELATKSANIDTFKKLGYLMVDPDDNGRNKRNEIYQVIISLPERVKAVKALSETLKHLINLERQAYGIDDMQPHKDADQISQLMDELSQK